MRAKRSDVDTGGTAQRGMGEYSGRRRGTIPLVRPLRGMLPRPALCWFWMALLVTAVAAGGCGGCGGKKKAAPPPSGPAPARPAPVKPEPVEGPGEEQPPGTPAKPEKPAPKETPKEQPKPVRPENLSEWKKEDYFSAKAENDPKLAEAIQLLGQKSAGNVAAVKTLIELLQVEVEKPEPKPEPKPGEKPGEKPGGKPGEKPEEKPSGKPGEKPAEKPGPKPGPVQPPMPPPGAHGPVGQPPKTIQLGPEATKAAVAALAINGTADARKVLEALLAGKIDTGNDQVAAEAVLQGLAAQPDPAGEDILFRVLTVPEQFRPEEPNAKPSPAKPRPGTGPGYPQPGQRTSTTAVGLQQATLALVKVGASARLRERIARHLVDRNTPLAQVELLGAFLKEPHADNLRAQLILYGAPDAREEMRTKFLQYFTKYSSDALGLALGVSVQQDAGLLRGAASYPARTLEMTPPMHYGPATPGAGQPSEKPDPDLPYRLANELWGREFMGFLDGSLAKVDSLDKQAQLVLLAATVPTDAMRLKVYRLLQDHWLDGTRGLEAAGFPAQVITDPGLLVTVKMLPRAKVAKTTGGTAKPRPGSTGAGSRPAPVDSVQGEKDARDQAEQDWLRVSADMVRVLCQRFHTATQAEAEAARQRRRDPDFSAALKGLPVEIQGKPEIEGAYRLAFPDQLQKKLPNVPLGPMLIHYARLKQKERLGTVVGYYKRQLHSRRAYESPEGVWLDASRATGGEKRKQSIDVLISKAGSESRPGAGPATQPARGGPATQPARKTADDMEDLIIQILSVEIFDPSQEPGGAAPKPES